MSRTGKTEGLGPLCLFKVLGVSSRAVMAVSYFQET
jgi:hypothetical protein